MDDTSMMHTGAYALFTHILTHNATPKIPEWLSHVVRHQMLAIRASTTKSVKDLWKGYLRTASALHRETRAYGVVRAGHIPAAAELISQLRQAETNRAQ